MKNTTKQRDQINEWNQYWLKQQKKALKELKKELKAEYKEKARESGPFLKTDKIYGIKFPSPKARTPF